MEPADPDFPTRRPTASLFDLSPFAFQVLRAVIVLGALAMHLYWLDGRPPHFDEGVNGWFTDQMQTMGFYQYDPHNYHGPLHFYVLFLFKCLFGRNLWALRLPTALVGVLTIDWIFRFGRFLDRRLCVLAALGMTLSSGMLYYQRDAIHEAWLVFFLVLGAWGVFGLWQEGRKSQLWAVGLALAGMILTKETYLIHLGCLAAAVPCLLLAETLQRSRRSPLPAPAQVLPTAPAPDRPPSLWTDEVERTWWTPLAETFAPQHWRAGDAWAAAGVTVALVLFFYSGNFLNAEGITGLWRAYTFWGHTAEVGNGHSKVFSYWCKLLVRNEPLACLGVLACFRYAVPAIPIVGRPWQRPVGAVLAVGSLAGLALLIPGGWMPLARESAAAADLAKAQDNFALWLLPLAGLALGTAALGLPAPGDWRVRLLAIVGPGTLVAYSIIPYKTPWCIISLLWPFFFVAGALLAELADLAAPVAVPEHRGLGRYGRWIAWPLALALLVIGSWKTLRLSYVHPTSEKEDYVYVQTFNDVWKVTRPMLALAGRDPTALELPGVIVCGSTYPLPWLLGQFMHIGYYADNAVPPADTVAHADFLLVMDKDAPAVEPMLTDAYYRAPIHLRAALDPLTLYLRAARFRPVMDPARAPEFTPAAPAVPPVEPPAAP